MLLRKRIKASQKVILFRQLAYLLTPDYSVQKAIEFLRDDLDDRRLERILISIQQDLERGLSLYDSSAKYPELFSESELQLIGIGEKRKTLSNIFENLAEINESQNFVDKVWKKLFGSTLFYLIPSVLLIFLFSVFVLPVYADMFASFGSSMPVPTQLVISASQKWPLLIYLIIAIVFLSYLKKRIRLIQSSVDFAVLYIPIIGHLYKQVAIDNLVITLTYLIGNQTPAGETVRVAAMALNNNFLSRKLLKYSDLADLENRVSAALRQCKFIPRRLVRLIATTEQKDGDPAILEFTRDYYSDNTMESIIHAQEKLLIFMRIVFGIIIAVLAIGLYLPIFRMAGTLA